MSRIAIVGSGGSGKSTLARELGRALGLPVVHLDREFWKAGWVPTERTAWEARTRELVAGDAWVMDGNFGGTMELRLAAADTVVFLDLPRPVCLWRVVRRRIVNRGRSRPDMTAGCHEKLDLEFLRWVWHYPNEARPAVLTRLARLEGKRVVRLRSAREVRAFLAGARPT